MEDRPSARNPVVNPVVVLREEFDDWAVLYNPDTAEAVGIDPVGVVIWKLLDGRHTLADVVAEVRERFEGVPDAAAAEVGAFVADLARRGLVGVEWSPESR